MNPRVATLAALLAAISACAYFFLSSTPSPNAPGTDQDSRETATGSAAQPPGATETKPVPGNPPGAAAKKPAVNWKLFDALMGGTVDSGEAIPKPTPQDITRFLAKHGETAANLVAAFEGTKDRRWLDRALELFPNSPLVLMKAIEAAPNPSAKVGEKYGPDPERMALIERFKAADPNNPVPWFFAAQELFKAGPTAEAIAEIRAALERPAFYVYANERMDAAQQLYESLGLGQLEASALAMFGLTLPHMQAANQTSRMLMEWQKSAAESGSTASSDEALQLTYNLGRTFATPEASRLLIGQLVGLSMEKRALDALPAGSQPGWLKVDPAQRLSEIETEKQLVKEVIANTDRLLRSRDEQFLSEWLRRVRSDGESSALNWLKGQMR